MLRRPRGLGRERLAANAVSRPFLLINLCGLYLCMLVSARIATRRKAAEASQDMCVEGRHGRLHSQAQHSLVGREDRGLARPRRRVAAGRLALALRDAWALRRPNACIFSEIVDTGPIAACPTPIGLTDHNSRGRKT